MINEFATYKQSIKLKEFGFNEKCLGVYDPMYGLVYGITKFDDQIYKDSSNVLAPVTEQLFNFFRNKGIDAAVFKNSYVIELCNNQSIRRDGFECYDDSKNDCIDKIFELYLEKYKNNE